MDNKQIGFIKLDNLKLDVKNPRLPLQFSRDGKSQEEIINKFLTDDNLIELMLAIRTEGFFIGEALLVVKEGDHYVVIEGNRRLSSLKLLQNPDIATRHKRKIEAVLAEVGAPITEVPCLIFPNREDILRYVGYRHVTGIKPWSLNAKARYLSELVHTLPSTGLTEQSKELAKRIGSRSDHVRSLLVSYLIYQVIEDEGFFDIPGLDETTLHFNYIKDSLSREHIRDFIGVKLDSESPLENLKIAKLSELIHWFFHKNDAGKTQVIGDSKSLGVLNRVLSNVKATTYFRETGKLQDAFRFLDQSHDSFHGELTSSLETLRHAQSYMHNITSHYVSDKDLLLEVTNISKSMWAAIAAKTEEEH